MKYLLATLIPAAAALGFALHAARADKGDNKVDTRVFELRTYHTAPGKMQALNDRFRNHTNKYFARHGMTIVGFWTPADPQKADNTLVYLLAFPSREAAEKSWKAFRADPDWKAAFKESEKNGKLVEKIESVFLNPTDYSP